MKPTITLDLEDYRPEHRTVMIPPGVNDLLEVSKSLSDALGFDWDAMMVHRGAKLTFHYSGTSALGTPAQLWHYRPNEAAETIWVLAVQERRGDTRQNCR